MPLIFHGEGCGERLAARRGADVQHVLPLFKARGVGHELCRRVLHRKAALIEGRERCEVAGARKLKAARHPCVRARFDPLAGKLAHERLAVRFEGVHLRGDGRGLVVDAQKLLRLGVSQ